MATNLNNIHINSFTKGMNSDTSLDMIGNELYVFGLNIRITNSALVNKNVDSNNKQGIVTPVPTGMSIVDTQGITNVSSILATDSIDNIGVVITKDTDGKWSAYRVKDEGNGDTTTTKIFKSNTAVKDGVLTFSILMNKEEEGLVKVYIADCEHEIMCLNVLENHVGKTVDDIISNHLYPSKQLIIAKKISGILKTQQLQYAYRFYKRKGIASKLSPLTNKIQVISPSRDRENGNAEDTLTSIGFQLKIPFTFSSNVFDHVLVYRISYYKHNQNAQVNLIHDSKIDIVDGNILVNDTGLESLLELSIEEFASLNQLDIIPECIELNQHYLFAANITDKTMISKMEINPSDYIAYSVNSKGKYVLYKDAVYSDKKEVNNISEIPAGYYLNKYSDINIGDSVNEADACKYIDSTSKILGGKGKNISWKFVCSHIPLHTGFDITNVGDTIPIVDESLIKEDEDYLKGIYDIQKQISTEGIEKTKVCSIDDYISDHNLYYDKHSYDDIITSSMFRSLKRNEVYRYGIVIYDTYGRHTNVLWIADIRTPSESEFPSTLEKRQTIYSRPLGIQFNVSIPAGYTYQIVRCLKITQYTKNLLQCVLARPINQPLFDPVTGKASNDGSSTEEDVTNNIESQKSPYYPQQFLTSNHYRYYSLNTDDKYLGNANSFQNTTLFLIFNPLINILRQDLLQQLTNTDCSLKATAFVYGGILNHDMNVTDPSKYYKPLGKMDDDQIFNPADTGDPILLEKQTEDGLLYIEYKYQNGGTISNIDANNNWVRSNKELASVYKLYKRNCSFVYNYYNKRTDIQGVNFYKNMEITHIKDVLNPTWSDGWDLLTFDDDGDVDTGIKKYKQYTTNIGNTEYVNWVASNLYDLKLGTSADPYNPVCNTSTMHSVFNIGVPNNGQYVTMAHPDYKYAAGAQGPGPVCFLLKLKDHNNVFYKNSIRTSNGYLVNGSLLCNIQHTATQFAGLTEAEKQYDTYVGFGNTSNKSNYAVFDGDVYVMPCEIVTMFKAYDFNAKVTSIQSSQSVYYVPMETVINTYFDYGLNYRNTKNKNLQLKPGEIVGITVQERPITLYNMVYSDNNISNDVFNTESIEDELNDYPLRIFYSETKTDGEMIDSWSNFKSVNYIDADTRYGDITHLLTSKDVLYFWLKQGFGRLAVNERSLVTDNNSNTILLGQGGVLQRTDYIDTRHGMRQYDRAAVSAEGGIFWIDIMNKAVMSSDGQKAVDYGNITNVQNTINNYISTSLPTIDYDIEHNELLCKFLKKNADGVQLVFHIKLNIAMSLYTRKYNKILQMNNKLIGLNISNNSVSRIQYNYLPSTHTYLAPTELQFVVNPSSSTTKVFDDQEVVTMDRGSYNGDNKFLENKQYKFITNLGESNQNPKGNTDREGNIKYAIPRLSNSIYGNRIRGKWMLVNITDNYPRYNQSISHIVTKFRQSFS